MNHPEEPHCISTGDRIRGYSVHVLTASAVFLIVLAMLEMFSPAPSPAWVFLWLALTTLIDAVDGPLDRRWHVKATVPEIDGRTIDDILDYMTFTFVPLLLAWRMDWILGGRWAWVIITVGCFFSLFGFASTAAKDEAGGFFGGFPSYWNIVVFYFGLHVAMWGDAGRMLNTVLVIVLAVLTVLPVRFIYPNLAPPPWRWPVLGGAMLWGAGLLAMLPWYAGDVPGWAYGVSLLYPAAYVVLSVVLDRSKGKKIRSSTTPPS